MVHLDLALRSLDPDAGGARVVGVRRAVEVCRRDADGVGPGADDDGVVVHAGFVHVHAARDLGGFAGLGRLGVVEDLEDPGEGVEAEVEEAAACEVGVDLILLATFTESYKVGDGPCGARRQSGYWGSVRVTSRR